MYAFKRKRKRKNLVIHPVSHANTNGRIEFHMQLLWHNIGSRMMIKAVQAGIHIEIHEQHSICKSLSE